MTSKEINRANITAFVARAINRAGASAIDAEFGLRLIDAEITSRGNVALNFHGGVVLTLVCEPTTREIAACN